jgi:putative phage-type endonuclease
MNLQFIYDKDLEKPSELKLDYLRKQVKKLKDTHQPVQKSKEWYEMRNGLLTASDWGDILDGKNSVLKKKCGDDTFIGGAAIDWGNKYEQVANKIYEHRNNVEVLEFGCLKHPYIDFLGASPDGITHNGIMVEIKCPYSREITGIPKSNYWTQVQGQLEVCDLDRCDFIECCIKEYDNEKEYIEDNFNNNYELNQYGNEKGVIMEFYKKSDKTYFKIYSPLNIINEKLEEWKNNTLEQYITFDIIFFGYTYWWLKEVSCIPIYRNQEWFNNSKYELKLYWNKILKYRELGLDRLKEDILADKLNNTKKNKKEPIIKESVSKTQKYIKEYIVIDENNTIDLNNIANENNIADENNIDDYIDDFISKTNTSLFSN